MRLIATRVVSIVDSISLFDKSSSIQITPLEYCTRRGLIATPVHNDIQIEDIACEDRIILDSVKPYG